MSLATVPDHLKTKKKSKRVNKEDPYTLKSVSNQYKTLEMSERAVEKDPYALESVLEVFSKCPWSLICVADCCVRL